MESVTTLLEGEWNSFNGVDTNEDAYFMSQLLANFSFPNDSSFEIPSAFWPDHELTTSLNNVYETSHYWLDNTNTNPYSLSQDDIYNDVSSTLFPTSSGKSYEKSISSKGNEISVPEPSTETNNFSVNSRKRSCSMSYVRDSREKTKCRKNEKLVLNGNEDKADGDAVCKKITKIYRSDDDSNWSQESSRSPKQKGAEILNSNGKTRAGRGSATDPQSVYARKRRERINERLRILQHLIPNGTKVDISTMLEEAVQYVKFLQLQIKLLSSDDLWMYAPIAYNGMDIGLNNLMIPSP